jgi:hypothetical protein
LAAAVVTTVTPTRRKQSMDSHPPRFEKIALDRRRRVSWQDRA